MTNPFVSKYREAEKCFSKLEKKLSIHVARLDAARESGTPSEVTKLRTQAVQLEKRTIICFDELEEARRRYWEDKAKTAQASLKEFAPGLVAEAAQCWRNSGRPGLQGGTGVIEIVKQYCMTDMPSIVSDGEVPEESSHSEVLESVENEIW